MNKIILQDFCSNDEGKPHLSRPWSQDGFTYASDGAIIVRIAGEQFNPINRMPVEILGDWSQETACLPWLNFSKCSVCNGEKEQVCSIGRKHKCPSCGGSGLANFSMVGQFECMSRAQRIGLGYITMIASLPGAVICPSGSERQAVAGRKN